MLNLEEIAKRLYNDLESNNEFLKNIVKNVCGIYTDNIKLLGYYTYKIFNNKFVVIRMIIEEKENIITIDCH